MSERVNCVVADQHCMVPANLVESAKPTRMPTCVVCDEHVCADCSMRTDKGRVCNNCMMDQPDGPARVARRLHAQSGHTITLAAARRYAVAHGWTR